MKKRKSRRRRKSGMKFGGIVGIMFVAVILGFLTARFVVGPMIGYDSDTSPIKEIGAENADSMDVESEKSESKKNESEKANSEKTNSEEDVEKAEDGYALQFGAFSTKGAATELASDLKRKGIDCKIMKDDSMYKVISPLIDSKDEALEKLKDVSENDVEDVFIAKF